MTSSSSPFGDVYLKPLAWASSVPVTLRPLPPNAGRIHTSGSVYTRPYRETPPQADSAHMLTSRDSTF
jgi:hypothetical protein